MTRVVRSRGEFLAARRAVAADRVGAVLTMGALHDGHVALLDAARANDDVVITTVFVNPRQFGPHEDLSRYPRPLDADIARCEAAGVDLVWAPGLQDVYPTPPRIGIDPGPLANELEGAARPGHFAGVLLVVAKFLHLLQPTAAYFGAKDWQQLTLVRAMVADLEMGAGLGAGMGLRMGPERSDDVRAGVDIVAVETVRAPDGLALSSRNIYLNGPDRARATALSRALFAGRAAATGGTRAVLEAASAVLAADGLDVEYLEVRGPDLGPAPSAGAARLLVAARVGTTRLIDNVEVHLHPC